MAVRSHQVWRDSDKGQVHMLAQLGQGGIWELRVRSSWLAVRSVMRGIPELFGFQADAWKSSPVLKQEDPLLPFCNCRNLPLWNQ